MSNKDFLRKEGYPATSDDAEDLALWEAVTMPPTAAELAAHEKLRKKKGKNATN